MDMTINGRPLAEFGGAVLMDYSIGETPITTDYFQGINRTNFKILKSRYALRQIRLNLVFEAATLREAKLQRSRFNAELAGRAVLYIPEDGFYYSVFAENLGAETVAGIGDSSAIIQSALVLRGLRHDAVVTETLTDGRLYCRSTMPFTDGRFTVTVAAIGASGQYSLCGVVFSNVSVGDTLIVDTVNGRITRNGANVAAAFTAFPQLVPGENSLIWGALDNGVVTAGEPLTVRYYPVYI